MQIKKINVPSFTLNNIKDLCKVNPDCIIKKEKVEELEYITIDNFLLDPEKFKDYVSKFPAFDRQKSAIESSSFSSEWESGSKAPGLQQSIENIFLEPIGESIHKILYDLNFCRYEYDKKHWDFYTNLLTKDVEAYNVNNFPHIDPFTYACNIFLTDVEDTGTDFFKIKGEKKYYYHAGSLVRSNTDTAKYFDYLSKIEKQNKGVQNWSIFNGDDVMKKYHTIPAKYNRVSIYKGQYWHSINYDHTNPKFIDRYSVVGAVK